MSSVRPASWWVARLGAMSLPELAHRSWRLARHPIDLARIHSGRYARTPRGLARWAGPAHFYFDAVPAALGPALHDRADAICRGERDVLGLGRLALPDEPWHLEPLARVEWPRVAAGRVIGAAPAHLDPRLTWELGRGHDAVVLACAYASTREPRYRERLERDVASWRRANPLGTGIHWVSAMEAAIRIHSFAWIAAFLRGEQGALLGELAASIHEHVTFVARNLSRFSSANNHLIVELSGLVVGARALGDRDRLGRTRRRALAELDHEVSRQVLADGVDAEMATHYHAFVLEALDLVARLERAHGEPRVELERVVERMAAYLAAIRCDDGSLLAQGDSDDGVIVPTCVRDHVLPPTTGPAPLASHHFEVSGQIVLRSPRLLATFDAGPFGFGSLAAHAHCDALALAVAIDGKPFLVDRGTYRYNGDRTERDRFRATAAHNTLQLGAREQADAAGPFLWSRRPTVTMERCDFGADGDVVVASHDGFAPWRHRRTLLRFGDMLCVVDEIDGPPTSEVATSRYHLVPGLDVKTREHAGGSLCEDRASGAWLWSAGATRVVHTPHSAHYGVLATAPTLEIDAHENAVAVVGPRGPHSLVELRAFATRRHVTGLDQIPSEVPG